MLPAWSPLSDYRDIELATVVSVTWAGRIWRLSDRELTGAGFHALPGLLETPDVEDSISLESGDVGASVSIGLVLPAIDVAAYVAAGADLEDLTAEVSLVWHRGGTLAHDWAAREVLVDGDADEPQYGDPTQPAGWIACTIEDSPYRVERPIVRRTWVVTADTWPTAPAFGARYPLVLGVPDPDGDGGGPPAPVVDDDGAGNAEIVLVSIGWCVATQVDIVDADGLVERFGIAYRTDGLSQICAVATIAGAAVISRTSTYTSSWPVGAALAPFGGSRPLHVAAYLLSLGGADLDIPEWIRVGELVEQVVGGYVDDPDTEAWEVARDLLSGLPVTTRRDRDGWAPVVLDPGMAEALSVARWRESGPYRRVSSWQATGNNRITRVEIANETSEITVGATASIRDAGLPHSWARHLPRQDEASESPSWSWSATFDYRALQWLARIGALGWEASAWNVPGPWGRVRAGDWIELVDDARFALVQRRTLTDGVWDYTLVRPRGR